MEKSPAVRIDLPIAEVKVIGTPIGGGAKPRGSGRKPKMPVDGDGDGICFEATNPVPCPPGVPTGSQVDGTIYRAAQQISAASIPGQAAQAMYQKIANDVALRKQSIVDARVQNQHIKAKAAEARREADDLINELLQRPGNGLIQLKANSPKYKPLLSAINEAFEMDLSPDVYSKVDTSYQEISFDQRLGTLIVTVGGSFRSRSNNRAVGLFERTLVIGRNKDWGGVKHDNLEINPQFRGQGLGSTFTTLSNDIYRELDIPKILVTAAKEDGAYTWARAGFDWLTPDDKKNFLDALEANADRFYTADVRQTVLDLIAKARSEKFESPTRITPYIFSLFDGTHTLLMNFLWNGIMQVPHGEKTKAKSAVVITANVSSVKLFGFDEKALQRIRDLGGPDVNAHDGDGDGLVDDGTAYERPAPEEVVPDVVNDLWHATHAKSHARRMAVARERLKLAAKRKVVTVDGVRSAIEEGNTDAARFAARLLFEHKQLGFDKSVSSKIVDVGIEEGNGNGAAIRVAGIFVDDSGQTVGKFSRYVYPDGLDGRSAPMISHDELNLTPRYGIMDGRGMGISQSFGVASEIQYARSGYKEITLIAALEDGPSTWSKDGFDWEFREGRDMFLRGLLSRINSPNAEAYFSSKEEMKAYRNLIAEALNQRFESPDRLRAVHFTSTPRFREIAKLPSTVKMAYSGARPVRNYKVVPPRGSVAEKSYDLTSLLEDNSISESDLYSASARRITRKINKQTQLEKNEHE